MSLRRMVLHDFVIVRSLDLDLDLEQGFTVLTGETGAGKSILIDALQLVLGARADAGVVREGAQRCEVAAEFDLPANARPWLDDNGFTHEEGEALLLKRSVDTQGRSRAWINGQIATLTQLRELGQQLVDIHGQHAHQSLLRAGEQRRLLDAQAGLLDDVQKVQQQWQLLSKARERLERARQASAGVDAEREQLGWQIEQLDALALEPGSWDSLEAEHRRLAHAQSLIDGAQAVIGLLDEADVNADRLLADGQHRLEDMAGHDERLRAILESVDSARIAVADASSSLQRYLQALEPDPPRLAELDERISAILACSRRLRCQPDEIPARLAVLREHLQTLQDLADLDGLAREVDRLELAYRALATPLSGKRAQAAKRLSEAVTLAMQDLGMPGGRFEVVIETAEAGPFGHDAVEFRVAGHAGSSPKALAKVASGGELARISLALSVTARQASPVPTLIFDEVDSGVGGAVAEKVGRLLRDLGQRSQVLCVTHLPQVAACADEHAVVSKQTIDGLTLSRVSVLDRRGRIDEIARMLGGLDITATTRRHAQEMLGA